MRHHRAQALRSWTTPNAVVTPLATPRLGASDLSVIRQRMAPGHANPLHSQTAEEVMVMLEGTVQVRTADACHALEPGDSLVIPAGVDHSLTNTGAADAEWLIISPAGVRFRQPGGSEMRPEWAA